MNLRMKGAMSSVGRISERALKEEEQIDGRERAERRKDVRLQEDASSPSSGWIRRSVKILGW